MSAYQFLVEYRPGKKHGNADAMSRRQCNPADCKCPVLDKNEEILRCGPCSKCKRRAEAMESSLFPTSNVQDIYTNNQRIGDLRSVRSQGTQTSPSEVVEENNMIAPKPVKRKKYGRRNRKRGCGSGKPRPRPGPQVHDVVCRRMKDRSNDTTIVGPDPEPWVVPDSAEELREKQLKDPDLAPMIKWKEDGNRPFGPTVAATSPATRHYWLYWDNISLIEGVLFRKFEKRDGSDTFLQLIAPRAIQGDILYHMHKGVLGGHLGKQRTTEHVLQNYYWHDVRTDADLYVMQCESCQKVKEPSRRPRAPLGQLPVGGPLDRVGVDILGPLPLSKKNNRYILVAIDHFTKWTEIMAIPDQSAETCTEYLLNEFFARFGTPTTLLSDQGTNFESKLLAALCRLLEIRKLRTVPNNPKCNGMVERMNRTIIRMIKCFLKGEQDQWDRHLGCLAGAYRQTRHESTGLSPNMMMLGREVRSAAEIQFGIRIHKKYSQPATYVQEIRTKMQHAHDLARMRLDTAAQKRKAHYDQKVQYTQYKVGDLVLLETERNQFKIAPKLRVPYQGPYMVYRTHGVDCELQLEHGKRYWFNHNRLKPYMGIRFPAGYIQALEAAKAEDAKRKASLA